MYRQSSEVARPVPERSSSCWTRHGTRARTQQRRPGVAWHASCITGSVGPAASAYPFPKRAGAAADTSTLRKHSRRSRRTFCTAALVRGTTRGSASSWRPARLCPCASRGVLTRSWDTRESFRRAPPCCCGARRLWRGLGPGAAAAHRERAHGERRHARLRDGHRRDHGRAELRHGAGAQPLGGPLLRLVYSPADNVELDLEWVARVGVWDEAGPRGPELVLGRRDPAREVAHPRGRRGRPTLGARFASRAAPDRVRGRGVPPARPRAEHDARRDRGAAVAAARTAAPRPERGPAALRGGVSRARAARLPRVRRGARLVRAVSLSLVAEVAGRAGDGMRGADQSSEARVGLRLGRGRLRGSAALRRGLLSTDGEWGATLGLTWTVRSPRP